MVPFRVNLHLAPPSPRLKEPHSLFSLFPFSYEVRANITPSFSYLYVLFVKECFANSFAMNSFRTLLQNTGGYPLTKSCPASPKLFTTRYPLFTSPLLLSYFLPEGAPCNRCG